MKSIDNEGAGKEENKAPTLKTPQSIIHIKHRITLQQYKYWILLLQELRMQFEAIVQPDEDGFYKMPMSKLAEHIGYTPNKLEINHDLRALKNEDISYNMLGKDGSKELYGS
jgi:hypothetical protein